MVADKCAEILNELLNREQRSLTVRIGESTLFVPRLSVDTMHLIERLAKTAERNCAGLAELILEVGGALPPLRSHDATSAELHYLQVRHVMPRVLADQEALVRVYTTAAGRLADEPQAGALVAQILARHRDNAAAVRRALTDHADVVG